MEGTLEDMLSSNIDELNVDLLSSCMFQVSFALNYLQKHFTFTHNDLHVNNVMFKKTDRKFLYYKLNNQYFKIPTYGYLFKIIDFGRAIFTFHNKLYFNDNFEKFGEAEGQFDIPFDLFLFNKDKGKREKFKQNFNFDLCRLAITILDVIEFESTINYDKKQSFVDFIYQMTIDNENNSLFDLYDDFNMYIDITKKSCNALPNKILQNDIFNQFKIKKKNFPKKCFYHL